MLDNNPGTYLKVSTGAVSITAPNGAVAEVLLGEVGYGGEPELICRGSGTVRRDAARRVQVPVEGLFKASSLGELMQ